MKFVFALFLVLFSFTEVFAEGFKRGTLVKVPNGYTAIEDLKAGDLVVSCDLNHRDSCIDRKITHTFSSESSALVEIQVNNQYIVVDQDHQFFIPSNRSWAKAKYLAQNSELFSSEEISLNVDFVDHLAEKQLVYSISVEGIHNYFVTEDDILVHNWPPAWGGAIVQGANILLTGGGAAVIPQVAPSAVVAAAAPVVAAVAGGTVIAAVAPALIANAAPHVAKALDNIGAKPLGDVVRISGGVAQGIHKNVIPSEVRDFVDELGNDLSKACKEGV